MPLVSFYANDSFKYNICHYSNSCFDKNTIFIDAGSEASSLNLKFMNCCVYKIACENINEQICHCRTPRSEIKFVDFNSQKDFINGSAWMINQWHSPLSHVTFTNPAHFSFKMVLSGIILKFRKKYELPKEFDTLIWQDKELYNMTDYEKNIIRIIKDLAQTSFKSQIFGAVNRSFCFKSVYTSQLLQVYANLPDHLDLFKQSASKIMKLNFSADHAQPKLVNALILLRSNGFGLRKFVNMKAMEKVLHKYNIVFESKIISAENSSYTQAVTFNSYNIIIAPHSSQLANILFCKSRTVILMITPYYIDSCFKNLALMSRSYPIISTGHKYSNYKTGKLMEREKFPNATIAHKVLFKKHAYKHNIFVNISIFEKDLLKAMKYLKKI